MTHPADPVGVPSSSGSVGAPSPAPAGRRSTAATAPGAATAPAASSKPGPSGRHLAVPVRPSVPPGMRLPHDPNGWEWLEPPRPAGVIAEAGAGAEVGTSRASNAATDRVLAPGGGQASAPEERTPLLEQAHPALPALSVPPAVLALLAPMGPPVDTADWPRASDVLQPAQLQDVTGAHILWLVFQEFAKRQATTSGRRPTAALRPSSALSVAVRDGYAACCGVTRVGCSWSRTSRRSCRSSTAKSSTPSSRTGTPACDPAPRFRKAIPWRSSTLQRRPPTVPGPGRPGDRPGRLGIEGRAPLAWRACKGPAGGARGHLPARVLLHLLHGGARALVASDGRAVRDADVADVRVPTRHQQQSLLQAGPCHSIQGTAYIMMTAAIMLGLLRAYRGTHRLFEPSPCNYFLTEKFSFGDLARGDGAVADALAKSDVVVRPVPWAAVHNRLPFHHDLSRLAPSTMLPHPVGTVADRRVTTFAS